MELGGNENTAIIYGDGAHEEARAFGLFGGMQGLPNRLELELPDGRCISPKLKDKIDSIPPGSVLRQWAGGGGGYGDPYARPVALVQAEVRDELLSRQCAERDYGVQINGQIASRNGHR